jgi:hypothetical protein
MAVLVVNPVFESSRTTASAAPIAFNYTPGVVPVVVVAIRSAVVDTVTLGVQSPTYQDTSDANWSVYLFVNPSAAEQELAYTFTANATGHSHVFGLSNVNVSGLTSFADFFQNITYALGTNSGERVRSVTVTGPGAHINILGHATPVAISAFGSGQTEHSGYEPGVSDPRRQFLFSKQGTDQSVSVSYTYPESTAWREVRFAVGEVSSTPTVGIRTPLIYEPNESASIVSNSSSVTVRVWHDDDIAGAPDEVLTSQSVSGGRIAFGVDGPSLGAPISYQAEWDGDDGPLFVQVKNATTIDLGV